MRASRKSIYRTNMTNKSVVLSIGLVLFLLLALCGLLVASGCIQQPQPVVPGPNIDVKVNVPARPCCPGGMCPTPVIVIPRPAPVIVLPPPQPHPGIKIDVVIPLHPQPHKPPHER